MNNVVLIGRLTKDPELAYGGQNSDIAVCRFTLAVDRPTQDKAADFIRIVVFRKQAENAKQYLAKGRQCAVEGRIQTGRYKDREGKTVYTTDVIANSVEFLLSRINNDGESSRAASGNNSRQQGHQQRQPRQPNGDPNFQDAFGDYMDDVPF